MIKNITKTKILSDTEEDSLHIEELQDIITAPPAWLVRCGIGIFFSVIVSVIAESLFIKYPDNIKTSMVIKSIGIPVAVVAGKTGRITSILVHPGQFVAQKQELAYIESSTDNKQALTLLKNLLTMRSNLFIGRPLSDLFLKNVNVTELGDLQASYEEFYLSYMSNKKFVKDKDWSKLAYFSQSLNKLIDDIQKWKSEYILSAPAAGYVQISGGEFSNQIIKAGEEIFYIHHHKVNYFGQILLTPTIIEKLRIGQKVIVTINQFPVASYGAIEGVIKSISNFPLNNGNYTSIVEFRRPYNVLLNSSYIQNGMLASANITTENISLFTRMTGNLFKRATYRL